MFAHSIVFSDRRQFYLKCRNRCNHTCELHVSRGWFSNSSRWKARLITWQSSGMGSEKVGFANVWSRSKSWKTHSHSLPKTVAKKCLYSQEIWQLRTSYGWEESFFEGSLTIGTENSEDCVLSDFKPLKYFVKWDGEFGGLMVCLLIIALLIAN